MCGRYSLGKPGRLDPGRLGVRELPALAPRFNIVPGQEVAVVLEEGGARCVELVRWGLVPSWAEHPGTGPRLANARADTVHVKPSFRTSFRKRRCLVLADGFFEWQVVEGRRTKQPWFVQQPGGEPFAFAGLWDEWRPKAYGARPGQGLRSCTIITTDANRAMAPIHDRMPVLLAPGDYARWLGPVSDPDRLRNLLVPAPEDAIEAWPVSTRVNAPTHDDPDLLTPLTA